MKSATRIILIIVAVLVVVGGIVGYGVYNEQVRPFRHVVIEIDDVEVSMGYFLKRLAMTNTEPLVMLTILVKEELVLLRGPQPPYNIKISDQDIESFLREQARGTAESIPDAVYREWFRQQLNDSGLNAREFPDLMRRTLMAQDLGNYLGRTADTVLPHVLLHAIQTADAETAEEALARLRAGNSFELVATALNEPTGLRRSGGEWGWFARASLPDEIGFAVFEELGLGEFDGPFQLDDGQFVVVRLTNRVEARQVADDALSAVRAAAVDNWINTEIEFHNVDFHGFTNGYDAETDAWVRWQLQRLQRENSTQG